MSKKVLIVASSPRRKGNSNCLAESFAKGAEQAGHQVETVYLCEKDIGFCRGCLSCQTTQRCVIQDDADTIAQHMGVSDVLVFATPIYYYGMSGQMKTMLDRGESVVSIGLRFPRCLSADSGGGGRSRHAGRRGAWIAGLDQLF